MQSNTRLKRPAKISIKTFRQSVRRRNKFNAQRVTRHGITFHSGLEADRYDELLLLQQANLISQLRRQVRYKLNVNGVYITSYIADFIYFDKTLEIEIVEDVKGKRTHDYIIKRNLMRAIHGIKILETGGRKSRSKRRSKYAK